VQPWPRGDAVGHPSSRIVDGTRPGLIAPGGERRRAGEDAREQTLSRAGRNWAGNVVFSAAEVAAPTTVDEVADLVRSTEHVRVVGSRHSFSDIADTAGTLLSLAALAGVPEFDCERGVVRVPGGLRYGDLAPWLHDRGGALANLASLPHISIAGAVATGTHGSGERIGSLATQVSALEMVDGEGGFVRVERGDPDFEGSVVSLGSLGVVTALELDTEPTFEMAQTVFEGARWDDVLARFDDLQRSGDSVSIFTTWRDADAADQVWVKSRGDAPDLSMLGAHPADGPRHPLPGIDPEPCTPQRGRRGPWFDRLPHFRLAFTPSAGEELQTEYLVPPRIAPLLQVCEVRTVAADDLWLSPASGTDVVGLHFTWVLDQPAVLALLPEIEAALPPSTRPHWGKLFALSGDELTSRYPRWDDVVALRARRDPHGRFANAWTARLGL
jgi:xylitol oxidase